MSAFSADLDNSLPEMLETFGDHIYIRGLKFLAIFRDEEYEDEAGFRRIVSITLPAKEITKIKKGDSVIAKNEEYYLKAIPDIDSELIEIELKRA